ncbi:MAG: hypothetical protein PVF68_17455 [Acidobacteriota bacterium]|jgi:methyl-accepting chemotaxis protein
MSTPSQDVAETRLADLARTVEEPRADGRRALPLIGVRRTLLIKPEFQLRAMALPTIVSVATVTALIFTVYRLMMAASYQPSTGPITSLWGTPEARWLLNSVAGALAFAAILVLIGLVETHRAAGAIYKIQRHLNRISEGHFDTRVYLRKRDHFQDFAEDFNRMVEDLREDARMDLHEVNQAIAALGQVRPEETDESSARLARAWDHLVELKHRKEKLAR